MITHMELQLKLPEQEAFRPNMAYALYGALCGCMEPGLADHLHAQEITPLRQHVRPGPEPRQCVWVLDLFREAQQLTSLLQSWEQIPLQCCASPPEVLQCTASPLLSVADLLAYCADWPDSSLAQISFEAPCTFKVDGKYAQFPSTELIAQSLFMRWNALMPECAMEDEDAFHMLVSGLTLRRYRLTSRDYWLKGQRIPGFVGSVQFSTRLSAPIMELWRLLVAFAPYCGIGVKTALGMGAVTTSFITQHTRQ